MMWVTISIVSVCCFFTLWAYQKRTKAIKKSRKARRKSQGRPDVRFRSPLSSYQQTPEIIYTTVGHKMQEKTPSFVPKAAIVNHEEFEDGLSLNSLDLSQIGQNPEFKREPIAFLRRIGATNKDVNFLIKHPNFINDPLAAFRSPGKKENDKSEKMVVNDEDTMSITSENPVTDPKN